MMPAEMKEKYYELYEYMAQSREPKNMKAFGKVMSEMMEWFIVNKPSDAEAWLEKLESIKWKNYLTSSEADKIVAAMEPKAPWTRDQWRTAMEQHDYELDEWPCYNRCALYVTMQMIMSDSSATLKKYAGSGDMFELVHALALDKLKEQMMKRIDPVKQLFYSTTTDELIAKIFSEYQLTNAIKIGNTNSTADDKPTELEIVKVK